MWLCVLWPTMLVWIGVWDAISSGDFMDFFCWWSRRQWTKLVSIAVLHFFMGRFPWSKLGGKWSQQKRGWIVIIFDIVFAVIHFISCCPMNSVCSFSFGQRSKLPIGGIFNKMENVKVIIFFIIEFIALWFTYLRHTGFTYRFPVTCLKFAPFLVHSSLKLKKIILLFNRVSWWTDFFKRYLSNSTVPK